MKKNIFFIIAVLTFFSSSFAHAEIITGGSAGGMAIKYTYRTLDAKGKEVYKSNTSWGQGLKTEIHENDTDFDKSYATCVDLLTTFKTGTEYVGYNLLDTSVTFMSELQKSSVVSLFSHAYGTLETGKLDWKKEMTYNQINVMAFQLSVWEILMENPTDASYSLSDGWFYTTGPGTINDANTAKYEDAFALANTWLSAVNDTSGSLWNELGYQAVAYDYTLWVPENGKSFSQSLVTVAPAATPEPASMFIFGAGLFGLGFFGRNRFRLMENAG